MDLGEKKLEARLRLTADLCDELRQGHSPYPLIVKELRALGPVSRDRGRKPAELKFVEEILDVVLSPLLTEG